MSGTSIFIGTTSCFRLGPLKSGMFCKVESNVKMTRCRLQGGDDEVGMARWRLESRERPKLEDAGGRERLLGWRRLEGRARLLGWSRLVQGEAVKLEEAVDGEVKMVRWR